MKNQVERVIKFRVWEKGIQRMGLVKLIIFNGVGVDRIHLFDGGTTDTKASVLMQYTGLKDKNGKEIWEGDILGELRYGTKCVVKWNNLSTGFTPFEVGVNWEEADEIKVIGNLYENPELLTDTTQ